MQISSGPSPSTPGPTGAWGGVVALPSHHQGGLGLEGIFLMVPHPTSCGFGLAHQLFSCECSLHHHRLPQLKLGGGRARSQRWAWPGMAPPQNQAIGTREGLTSLEPSGRELTSTFYLFIYFSFFFFLTESQLMNVTLGVLGPGSCGDISTFSGGTEGAEAWPSLWPSPKGCDSGRPHRGGHTWHLLTERGSSQARQGPGNPAHPLRPALLSLETSSSAESNQSCLFRA